MTIYDQILEDIRNAMKAREADRLRVLRSLKSKLMEREISERTGERGELDDDQAVEVLMKAAKQRKESIDQFEKGDRQDLADAEKKELEVIESYLPKMLSEEEVRKVVRRQIERIGATGPGDMGSVMGVVMKELKGKADGSLVNRVVREELAG